jgi:hypothetical protein
MFRVFGISLDYPVMVGLIFGAIGGGLTVAYTSKKNAERIGALEEQIIQMQENRFSKPSFTNYKMTINK